MSVMGPFRGLKQVRKLVEDCMANYHPIYHIKTLMIKRELEKDPKLANESWDRFLPKFKKKNVKRKKPSKIGKGKKDQKSRRRPSSKIDKQIASGEYFLSQDAKRRRAAAEKLENQKEALSASRKRREEAFVAPREDAEDGEKKKKRKSDVGDDDVAAAAARLAKKGSEKKSEERKKRKSADASAFVRRREEGEEGQEKETRRLRRVRAWRVGRARTRACCEPSSERTFALEIS